MYITHELSVVQMMEVGELEDLGWDGGQTVAVEAEDLQVAGQVGEAAQLQRGDTIVVEIPEKQRVDFKNCSLNVISLHLE